MSSLFTREDYQISKKVKEVIFHIRQSKRWKANLHVLCMSTKLKDIFKVLFTYEYTWQNFRLRLLRHVNLLRSYSQDAKVVNESFAMCIHRWIMLYLRPQLNFLHFIYGIFNIYGQNYHFSGHINLSWRYMLYLWYFSNFEVRIFISVVTQTSSRSAICTE